MAGGRAGEGAQNGAGNDAWIATEPLRLRLAQIIPQFLIGTNAPVRQGFKYATFALVVAALVLLAVRFRRSSAFERSGVLVALALAVGGFALALLLILVGSDVLITRNVIELWLPAAIVVAAGCSAASGVTALPASADTDMSGSLPGEAPDHVHGGNALMG